MSRSPPPGQVRAQERKRGFPPSASASLGLATLCPFILPLPLFPMGGRALLPLPPPPAAAPGAFAPSPRARLAASSSCAGAGWRPPSLAVRAALGQGTVSFAHGLRLCHRQAVRMARGSGREEVSLPCGSSGDSWAHWPRWKKGRQREGGREICGREERRLALRPWVAGRAQACISLHLWLPQLCFAVSVLSQELPQTPPPDCSFQPCFCSWAARSWPRRLT